jgi:peptidoglycan/LPS O-acetylase OafA/YrhL
MMAGGYIPGIDGLRALAVLAVMLYHLDPRLLPGGFVGVDVFFVISGYVVSGSLARDMAAPPRAFVVGFYARRMRRIVPALVVCLLATTIASVLFVPEAWLSRTIDKTGLYAFFGVSNVALVRLDDGYFSPTAEFNPFTHTWSLAVEEQFYLVFPVLFFVWLRLGRQRTLAGLVAVGLMPLLLVASLAWAWWQTQRDPAAAFYLLPARFWELAAGAMLFQWQAGGRRLPSGGLGKHLCLLLGLLLVGGALIWSRRTAFPFPWALPAVAGALLTMAGLVAAGGGRPLIQRLLEMPVATHVGRMSYSLYLWHWPVYVLMRWTLGLESWWQCSLAVIASFLLAEVSYRFVETPVRRARWPRRRAGWQMAAAGVASLWLAWWLAGAAFAERPRLTLSATRDTRTWYPYAWPSGLPQLADYTGRTLFALGDSHAGAYATMLRMLSDQYGVTIRQHFTGGCPVGSLLKSAADGAPDCSAPDCSAPDCSVVIERHLAEIEAAAAPGDIVLLASLRVPRLCDQFALLAPLEVEARQDTPQARERRAQSLQETSVLIERLQRRGLTVVIDAPKPVFGAPAFRCVSWFNRHNPICAEGLTMDRAALLAHREPVMASLRTLASRYPHLHIWDPFPVLCGTARCSALDGDKPLFFDGDHLSAYGNRMLYPAFRGLVTEIWADDEDR